MSIHNLYSRIQCCSQNCQYIFESKEHILLGISPFNSYYNEINISLLLKWASETFQQFHVFSPDTLPIYNFLALGYGKEKAQKKASKQARYLKNKIVRAFESLGFSKENANALIIDMSNLEQNSVYQKHKNECFNLFENDLHFRTDCFEATEWILSGYQAPSNREADKQIAIRYLLEEMPLFLDTPSILNLNSSMFCYHQTPAFIKNLYTNTNCNRSSILSLQQGFIEVRFENQRMIQGESINNELRQ